MSKVLGRQRFNTAVSHAIVACTKRELNAAILWKQQFKDFKEDQFLVLVCGKIHLQLFSITLVRVSAGHRGKDNVVFEIICRFCGYQHLNLLLMDIKIKIYLNVCIYIR